MKDYKAKLRMEYKNQNLKGRFKPELVTDAL